MKNLIVSVLIVAVAAAKAFIRFVENGLTNHNHQPSPQTNR